MNVRHPVVDTTVGEVTIVADRQEAGAAWARLMRS
ncbi:hypothetical protein ABH926_007120 [Catenulispora sp. GP43]